jgi:alginate O-acetyltransferase complex protein AlgI
MLFPTLNFGLFFLAIFAASWALARRPEQRKLLLVAASYVFYAFWDWRFCFLLGCSTLLNWAAGKALAGPLAAPAKTRVLAGAVAINLAVLGFFKYYDFFLISLGTVLAQAGFARDLPLLSLVVPVAISFFTFHAISYLVDIRRGHLDAPAGLADMALYLSFFPQLVAGPIVRAAHFLPQIAAPADPDRIAMTRAFLLIALGLFKKVFVATWLASLQADEMFRDPSLYKAGDLLLGMYAYALQIYCDFSAYTDIAIGVAALLGYRFPINFDQPYRSASPAEFWRRWHISLSSWLRDYLFIPLGGSRGTRWQTARNLLVTMTLGGLWHGACFSFVVWGLLHGLFLIAHRFFRDYCTARPRLNTLMQSKVGYVARVALTFFCVLLSWVFFQDSLARALFVLRKMFIPAEGTALPFEPLRLWLTVGVLVIAHAATAWGLWQRAAGRLPPAVMGAACSVAFILAQMLAPENSKAFVYFQF